MVVPDVQDADAPGEVEIFVTINVPELRPLRLGNEDGVHVRHPARHMLAAQLQQGWGPRLIFEHNPFPFSRIWRFIPKHSTTLVPASPGPVSPASSDASQRLPLHRRLGW